MSEYNDPANTPPPLHQPPERSPGGISAEERQWAMFAHLSALVGGIVTTGWGAFIGPLVIWMVKKDTMPFVDDQAKEALNFNISVGIIFLALLLMSIVTFGIGWLVVTIIAGIKANEGVAYRYPLTLRLIK